MKCPFCENEKIRQIIYGDLGFRDEEDEKEFNKKFIEGGPEQSVNSPLFHCDNCSKDFGVAKGTGWGVANRREIKPGMRVAIVLKEDQKTGKMTEGIVKDLLTSKSVHPRGIKVRLTDGQVGRVQQIL